MDDIMEWEFVDSAKYQTDVCTTQTEGTLEINILCARDLQAGPQFFLGGYSNPYVKVLNNSIEINRTNWVNKNLNPTWNEQFKTNFKYDNPVIIRFEVWDKNWVVDDYLGYAEIPVQELPEGETIMKLKLLDTKSGELHLLIRCTKPFGNQSFYSSISNAIPIHERKERILNENEAVQLSYHSANTAMSCGRNAVNVFRIKTGEILLKFEEPTIQTAIHHEGKVIVATGTDIILWHRTSQKSSYCHEPKLKFPHEFSKVLKMAWTQTEDLPRLSVCGISQDKMNVQLKIWNFSNLEEKPKMLNNCNISSCCEIMEISSIDINKNYLVLGVTAKIAENSFVPYLHLYDTSNGNCITSLGPSDLPISKGKFDSVLLIESETKHTHHLYASLSSQIYLWEVNSKLSHVPSLIHSFEGKKMTSKVLLNYFNNAVVVSFSTDEVITEESIRTSQTVSVLNTSGSVPLSAEEQQEVQESMEPLCKKQTKKYHNETLHVTYFIERSYGCSFEANVHCPISSCLVFEESATVLTSHKDGTILMSSKEKLKH